MQLFYENTVCHHKVLYRITHRLRRVFVKMRLGRTTGKQNEVIAPRILARPEKLEVQMKELKKRDQVNPEDLWNISAVYKDSAEYEADFKKVKQLIADFASLKGTIKDATSYLDFAKKEEETERLLGKLFVYGNLKYNEDMTNQDMQTLNQRGRALFTQYGEVSSFAEPEILALPDEVFENIINAPEVAPYRFHLERKRHLRDHIMSNDKEEVMASLGEVRGAPQSAFSIFSNAEMSFPKVKDEAGEEHLLTNGTYGQLIKSKDRTLRKNAFEALHNTYGKNESTLGFLLTTNLKDWIIEARLRNYENSVEKALKPNNIPVSVFYNSIDTIHDNVELLHRYVDLKKRILGLDEMHLYDLYVPLAKAGDQTYSFDEAVDIALDGLKPMGDDYTKNFKAGIEDGWIDKYENVGKRSGAYSSGTYDTMPYISLNFDGTMSDVSTFVHEMGHSMHSFYSRGNQPYIYGNYSIFLAEVASTCNEKLLIHDLIEKETDRDKRIALINQELEQIRTTVYRQLMFATFEKITHERLEAGDQLNAKDLNEIWLDLNKTFFGENMIIDEAIKYEWARIPHFYNNFYVYQYATGYAMASSFARTILEEGTDAAERYIDRFLKAGSSDYPVEVMKNAGVDITTPKPLEDTLKDFSELMDQLEKEYELK